MSQIGVDFGNHAFEAPVAGDTIHWNNKSWIVHKVYDHEGDPDWTSVLVIPTDRNHPRTGSVLSLDREVFEQEDGDAWEEYENDDAHWT